MSPIAEALERLSLAESELLAILELVSVNENPGQLPAYALVESIAGKVIRYRLESLFVHLWSAKDYYEIEIEEIHGSGKRATFSRAVHAPSNAQLVQYLEPV